MKYAMRGRAENNLKIRSAVSGITEGKLRSSKIENTYRVTRIAVKTRNAVQSLENATGLSDNSEPSHSVLKSTESAVYYSRKLYGYRMKKAAKEDRKQPSVSSKKQSEYGKKEAVQHQPASSWETGHSQKPNTKEKSFSVRTKPDTPEMRTRNANWEKRIRQKPPLETQSKSVSKKTAVTAKERMVAEAKKSTAQKAAKKSAKKAAQKAASSTAAKGILSGGGVIFALIALLLVIIIAFTTVFICIIGSQAEDEERKRQNASSATASVSDAVLQYEGLITQYANENGIGRYVPLIEAVMMQESGGQGVNVMQVAFTSVSTVEESIQQGIAYFRECLEMARVTSPEDIDHIKVALQGYNYGTGYITWVWHNYGGEYTEENAQLFSDMQKANLGWSIYGDPQYVPHVLRYYNSGSANTEFITEGAAFAWPVPGHTNITSGFGSRWGTTHKGIDISDGGIQGVPVVASRSGTVTRADNACTHNYPKNSSCGCGGGYGNRVEISHGDGTSTLYGHMVTITVSVGQTVEQGQVIGYVGSTGHSTGYHLHFEIKQNGVQVDPMLYL